MEPKVILFLSTLALHISPKLLWKASTRSSASGICTVLLGLCRARRVLEAFIGSYMDLLRP